jgi:hypothetical protein
MVPDYLYGRPNKEIVLPVSHDAKKDYDTMKDIISSDDALDQVTRQLCGSGTFNPELITPLETKELQYLIAKREKLLKHLGVSLGVASKVRRMC